MKETVVYLAAFSVSLACSSSKMSSVVKWEQGSSQAGPAIEEQLPAVGQSNAEAGAVVAPVGDPFKAPTSSSSFSNPSPGNSLDMPQVAPPVIIPTVVSGASLSCFPEAEGAICELRKSNVLVDPNGVQFYLITPQLAWIEISPRSLSTGIYFIEANLSVYGVGLLFPDKSQTATWVIPPASDSSLNLVKNGDFEAFSSTETTSQPEPGLLHWNVSADNPATCKAPSWDVHYQDPLMVAASGDRFLDLNSSCESRNYASHVFYQDLSTVTAGLYQVYFSYAPNPASVSNMGYSVVAYWNDKTAFSSVPFNLNASATWTHQKFTAAATGGTSRISFRDPAGRAEGAGTLLDQVRVFALGHAPQP